MGSKAAESGKEKTTRDISAILARNIWVQLFSIIKQIGILPLISPAQYSLLQVIQQLSGHSLFFQGGTLTALYYRYPQWFAEDRHSDCHAVQTITKLMCLLGAALFIPTFFILLWSQDDLSLQLHWAILFSVLSPLPLLSSYVLVSFQVRGEFQRIARIDLYISIVSVVLLIGAALYFGIVGLIIASLSPPIIMILFGVRFFKRERHYPWNFLQSKKHIFYGTRVWGGQAAARLANTSDVALLGFLIGLKNPIVGFFSLSLQFSSYLGQYLQALCTVHQHQIRLEIGRQGTIAAPNVRHLNQLYIGIECTIGMIGALVLCAFASLIFPLFFPKFAQGVIALGPVLLSIIIQRTLKYSRDISNQADRTSHTVVTSAIQFSLLVAGYLWIIQFSSNTLFHFGTARFAVFYLASMLQLWLSFGAMGNSKQGLILGARIFLAMIPTTVVFLLPVFLSISPIANALLTLSLLPVTYFFCNIFLHDAGKESLKLLTSAMSRWFKK